MNPFSPGVIGSHFTFSQMQNIILGAFENDMRGNRGDPIQ